MLRCLNLCHYIICNNNELVIKHPCDFCYILILNNEMYDLICYVTLYNEKEKNKSVSGYIMAS